MICIHKVLQPHCVLTVTNHSASAGCTVCGILNLIFFFLKKKGANLSNFWLSPAVLKGWKFYFILFQSFLWIWNYLEEDVEIKINTLCRTVAKELTQIRHLLPNTLAQWIFCHILSTLKKAWIYPLQTIQCAPKNWSF